MLGLGVITRSVSLVSPLVLAGCSLDIQLGLPCCCCIPKVLVHPLEPRLHELQPVLHPLRLPDGAQLLRQLIRQLLAQLLAQLLHHSLKLMDALVDRLYQCPVVTKDTGHRRSKDIVVVLHF